jgi:bifunctional non-homologous end joining protein LigD
MLWRTPSPRSRRLPPAGFILPCQPLLVGRPPAGLGWLHEVKHDGYRILARKEGSRVTLWSRYGTNFTDRLPKIAEALCSLAVESVLLDGEAVAARPGSARACLVAFDLLNLNGQDFRQRPIEDRRAALSPLVVGVHCILFSDALVAEGALVFAKACEMGLEGIVSKRASSLYRSGASRNWLKCLNPDFQRR